MAGRDDERAVRAMREHRLFSDLPEELLADLVENGHVRTYRSHSYVTMQGDPSDDVFMLLEGKLEVSTVSPESRPQLHTLLEPVRLFGELGVLAALPLALDLVDVPGETEQRHLHLLVPVPPRLLR